MDKMQFNHFPIISLWELSVAMAKVGTNRINDFETIEAVRL